MALIKTYNSVPDVYSRQSRDFQTIGHIFEAVFNSSKLATDMLDRMMPNPDFDERLLNLSTTTVGFIRKHEYNANDLNMILNSFAYLLRVKGTRNAIESALNILLRSQGLADATDIEIDPKKKLVTLYLSKRLEDLVLLTDLFDYILPFGFGYRIIQSIVTSAEGYPTKLKVKDEAEVEVITNEAIVNDTFKTTIEHVLPSVADVGPRRISNGVIVEEEPVLPDVVVLEASNLRSDVPMSEGNNKYTISWTLQASAWNENLINGETYTIEMTTQVRQSGGGYVIIEESAESVASNNKLSFTSRVGESTTIFKQGVTTIGVVGANQSNNLLSIKITREQE